MTIKLNARVYIGIEFAYEFKLCLKNLKLFSVFRDFRWIQVARKSQLTIFLFDTFAPSHTITTLQTFTQIDIKFCDKPKFKRLSFYS